MTSRPAIDGEPCGVLAVPIPELGDLRFTETLRRFYDALGASGGDRVVWRPIDDPRLTDEAYERLRGPEHEEWDRYSAGKFASYEKTRGNTNHHLAREYNKLARVLSVEDEMRPCIVFCANPQLGRRPILHVPPIHLATRDSQNRLGAFLARRLSHALIEEFLEDGRLNEESMVMLEQRVKGIEEELIALSGQPAHLSTELSSTSYAIQLTRDGKKLLAKSEYNAALESRDQFDLFVDAIAKEVWCAGKRRCSRIPIEPQALRMIADIIVADRPIRPRETQTGQESASAQAAYNAFYAGRNAIQRAVKSKSELFRITRCRGTHSARYEFTPQSDFDWVVFVQVNEVNAM